MWRFVVFSLMLISNLSAAQVPARLLARDAVRYLDLTAEQVNTLNGSQASWLEYSAAATLRAGRLEAEIHDHAQRAKPDRHALNRLSVELETICSQSRTRHRQSMNASRALLKPAQLAKLATLEQTLALMPVVEAAQSVNLLPHVLPGPPAGMPEGTVEVEFGYVRSTAFTLPGCREPRQVLRPGVDRIAPGK